MALLDHYSSSDDENERELPFLNPEGSSESEKVIDLEDGLDFDDPLDPEYDDRTPVFKAKAMDNIKFWESIALILQLTHNESKRTVLLIGIDGFRWDYLDMAKSKNIAPNLLKLMENGVRVQKLKPVFPSKTFPNHYTLVTGLYADSHGIIANQFYDPVLGKDFKVGADSSYDPAFWMNAEPVWLTLKKKDIDTAAVFWPGTDVEIRGERPRYWTKYDANLSLKDRVSKMMHHIDVIDKPQLLIMYLEMVDTAGHKHGPNSEQVKDALAKIDALIGDLLANLEKRQLLSETDIIISGDHGMTSLYPDRFIDISSYISSSDGTIYGEGPVVDIYLAPGADVDTVFNKVNTIPNVTAYKKADIPEYYHYKHHHRIAEIVLVADLGYTIAKDSNIWPDKGNHGYDPNYDDMRASLIASGPSFLSDVTIPEVENIHVYSLICHLFGLKEGDLAPNNGTISAIQNVLKPEFRP